LAFFFCVVLSDPDMDPACTFNSGLGLQSYIGRCVSAGKCSNFGSSLFTPDNIPSDRIAGTTTGGVCDSDGNLVCCLPVEPIGAMGGSTSDWLRIDEPSGQTPIVSGSTITVSWLIQSYSYSSTVPQSLGGCGSATTDQSFTLQLSKYGYISNTVVQTWANTATLDGSATPDLMFGSASVNIWTYDLSEGQYVFEAVFPSGCKWTSSKFQLLMPGCIFGTTQSPALCQPKSTCSGGDLGGAGCSLFAHPNEGLTCCTASSQLRAGGMSTLGNEGSHRSVVASVLVAIIAVGFVY